jgi:hypothetical protein
MGIPLNTVAPPKLPSIVVVMGAGSSADFGVPTLRSIFTNREAKAYLKQDGVLAEWLQKTFWEPRGHSAQTSERSVTIEEMLTILRDWQREPSVKQLDAAELDDIRRRLYVLIYHAVYENKSSDKGFLNGLIDVLGANFGLVTWASFNWDCIFESSFWYNSGQPGPYGGRTNPKPVISLSGYKHWSGKHEYLKLHGSVNWWLIDGKPTYLKWGSHGELTVKWNELSENKTADLPIILEPSAYKYEHPLYKQILEPQWTHFLKRLCEAACVLVIGYSLAENDLEARCKMFTAFQVNEACRWAVVDPAGETRQKYERLWGTKRLWTSEHSLAGFNSALIDNLKTAFPNVEIKDPRAAAGTPAPRTAT